MHLCLSANVKLLGLPSRGRRGVQHPLCAVAAPAAPEKGDLRLDAPVYQMMDSARTLEAKGRLQVSGACSW
jgi:hypothetical protein